MKITPQLLEEPMLEFGEQGQHIDPRLGLARYGPLQPMPGDRVSIGLIGTAETAEGFEQWMDRLKSEIPGKSDKLPNLFPPFPGLGNDNPFRCRFEVNPAVRRVLPMRDIEDVVAIRKHSEAVELVFDSRKIKLVGSQLVIGHRKSLGTTCQCSTRFNTAVLRDSGQRPPSHRRPGARCWAI